MDRGGFELPNACRELGLDSKWRYGCYSFSAASFPFFFLKTIVVCTRESLAGEEKYERKTRNQRVRVETFAGAEMAEPSTSEVSTMRMQPFVEKWTPRRPFWNAATLFLQRMWIALFKVVITFLIFLFSPSRQEVFFDESEGH